MPTAVDIKPPPLSADAAGRSRLKGLTLPAGPTHTVYKSTGARSRVRRQSSMNDQVRMISALCKTKFSLTTLLSQAPSHVAPYTGVCKPFALLLDAEHDSGPDGWSVAR
jgi:hypothetical protein